MPLKKILLIDDDPKLSPILKAFLQGKGYAVATATNGFDGISQIIIEDPDLILLGAILPKMNSLQFMRRIRENKIMQKIPVIMMISKSSVKDFFSDFIIEDFIRTPPNLEELLMKIEKLIGKQPAKPKRLLMVTRDKFLRIKVSEYFQEAGWEVHYADDHHDDVYEKTVEIYPDAILCQYWDKAWEGSHLDTKTLAKRLGADHLLEKIPFYVFCTGGAIGDAKEVFRAPRFIRYEKIADLLASINKRLDLRKET